MDPKKEMFTIYRRQGSEVDLVLYAMDPDRFENGRPHYDMDALAAGECWSREYGIEGIEGSPVYTWKQADDSVAVTCEQDGTIVMKAYKDAEGQTPTEHSYNKTIPATGHNWDEGVENPSPTCQAKGVRIYTCKNPNCNQTKEEDIPALDHNWSDWKVDQAKTDYDQVKTWYYRECDNAGTAEPHREERSEDKPAAGASDDEITLLQAVTGLSGVQTSDNDTVGSDSQKSLQNLISKIAEADNDELSETFAKSNASTEELSEEEKIKEEISSVRDVVKSMDQSLNGEVLVLSSGTGGDQKTVKAKIAQDPGTLKDSSNGIKVEMMDGTASTVAAVLMDKKDSLDNSAGVGEYGARVNVEAGRLEEDKISLEVTMDIIDNSNGHAIAENVQPATPIVLTLFIPEAYRGRTFNLRHEKHDKNGNPNGEETLAYYWNDSGTSILVQLTSLCKIELTDMTCKTGEGEEGHILSDWETTSEATCTANGECERHCTKDHCVYQEKQSISATGHNWGAWRVTKPASTSENGVETRTCSKCHVSETRPISKLPSTPSAPVQQPEQVIKPLEQQTPQVVPQQTPQIQSDKITIPKAPTQTKPTNSGKGKATINWKKFKQTKKTKAIWKQIKKVEVQYSTDRSFPKDATVSKVVGKSKTKLVVKGLQKGSTYYVRIRYTDGAGGYSNWSSTKNVKIKK